LTDRPVRVEVEDGVAGIVFSSPPVNALTHAFLGALDEALDSLPEGTHAIAVWSEVPRVFMAGADLDFLAHGDRERQREYVRSVQRVFTRFERIACPAVVGIDGACLGGGLELSLACDIRIVSASASLGLPEVRLGILPGAGGPERLVRAVGQGVTRDLVLTGRRLSAREAVDFGIASRLVGPGEAAAAARELARELAAGATEAIQAIKRLTVQASDTALEEALADEEEAWMAVRDSANAQEGLTAFLEKRPPVYR
jgi:enoyl-CoA hydratase/carnithine racemase